jgi:hypothetical protein
MFVSKSSVANLTTAISCLFCVFRSRRAKAALTDAGIAFKAVEMDQETFGADLQAALYVRIQEMNLFRAVFCCSPSGYNLLFCCRK